MARGQQKIQSQQKAGEKAAKAAKQKGKKKKFSLFKFLKSKSSSLFIVSSHLSTATIHVQSKKQHIKSIITSIC